MGIHFTYNLCHFCLNHNPHVKCAISNSSVDVQVLNSVNEISNVRNNSANFPMLDHSSLLCLKEKKYFSDSYPRMQERSSPSPTSSPSEASEPHDQKFAGLQLLANVVENIEVQKIEKEAKSTIKQKTVPEKEEISRYPQSVQEPTSSRTNIKRTSSSISAPQTSPKEPRLTKVPQEIHSQQIESSHIPIEKRIPSAPFSWSSASAKRSSSAPINIPKTMFVETSSMSSASKWNPMLRRSFSTEQKAIDLTTKEHRSLTESTTSRYFIPGTASQEKICTKTEQRVPDFPLQQIRILRPEPVTSITVARVRQSVPSGSRAPKTKISSPSTRMVEVDQCETRKESTTSTKSGTFEPLNRFPEQPTVPIRTKRDRFSPVASISFAEQQQLVSPDKLQSGFQLEEQATSHETKCSLELPETRKEATISTKSGTFESVNRFQPTVQIGTTCDRFSPVASTSFAEQQLVSPDQLRSGVLLEEQATSYETKCSFELPIGPIPSTSKSQSQSQSQIRQKTMKCEYCGKIFTHRGDMNKHLRSHTGEKPFECHICKRKFTHTSNLSRHILVHSGVKPFHCDRCHRFFSRKDKLILHQKTKLCIKYSQRGQK